MFLDAAEERLDLIEKASAQRPGGVWDDFPASRLSHHCRSCCDLALAWLRAMDFAQLNAAGVLSGPRWLRERYEWGPSSWPLYWCEAVEHEKIDCGAHAAFAHEVFSARGVTSFRAQFIQRYNRDAIEQWRRIWDADEASSHWLGEDCIYHEGNAVLVGDDRVKLWDGSACCWVKPVQAGGYGSLLSIRILESDQRCENSVLRWDMRGLPLNEWVGLDGG